MTADVAVLTHLINSEVIRAMGLPPEGWVGGTYNRCFRRPRDNSPRCSRRRTR
jgi:hypothetical protein